MHGGTTLKDKSRDTPLSTSSETGFFALRLKSTYFRQQDLHPRSQQVRLDVFCLPVAARRQAVDHHPESQGEACSLGRNRRRRSLDGVGPGSVGQINYFIRPGLSLPTTGPEPVLEGHCAAGLSVLPGDKGESQGITFCLVGQEPWKTGSGHPCPQKSFLTL